MNVDQSSLKHQLQRQLDEAAKEAAYKIGHDEFGLKDGDFAFARVKPSQGEHFVVMRGKSGITRLYFCSTMMDANLEINAEFLPRLRSALAAVANIKKTRQVDVIVWGGLKVPPAHVPSAYRHVYQLPPLLDREELDIKLEYKVTAVHKATGITVTKTGPVTRTFTRLIDEAREAATKEYQVAMERLAAAASQAQPLTVVSHEETKE